MEYSVVLKGSSKLRVGLVLWVDFNNVVKSDEK